MATLQTLDRGLQALTMIANAPNGILISDIAKALGIDRAIAYRIVSTLEMHKLIVRKDRGLVYLGVGALNIGTRFESQFCQMAKPHLDALANASKATAFLSLAEGDECIAIAVSEPASLMLRVGYQQGSRHPLNISAAGIAILAGRPETTKDTYELHLARQQGYSLTKGVLQKGAIGVATGLKKAEKPNGLFEASVGVVAMEDLDVKRSVVLIKETAEALDLLLG